MNKLTELAVSKRSVTMLLAFAFFVAGIWSWGNLKQELLPDIEFPVITVIAPYPGVGAADVATQVAEPIEQAISGVPRLERLQSTSANSIALVVAQFSFGTDVKETLAAIQTNLDNARLPATVEPDVSALNINAAPVVVSSITAASDDAAALEEIGALARNVIVPEIQAIEGVATADLTGGLETQVVVTLDPTKLAANGVSRDQIIGVLTANNLTVPSGQLPADGVKIPVSTQNALTSIPEIESLVVGVKGGPTTPTDPTAPPAMPIPLTIADLGTVEEIGLATTGYARTGTVEDGVVTSGPSLTLTITKTSNANTVAVAEAVETKLAEIEEANASVISVTTISDLSTFIIESRDGLLKEGGAGAVMAVLVIFLFLGSLRSTLVAGLSIPLSVLAALTVMQVTGVSINIMTLGGLAVAIGRVVDDSIVVLENIYRHRSLGDDKMTAVLKGPREVASAITASTLTTVAVFLPLGFVGGLVSQFFLPFALTVTFALLASLIVALTVVPVLAYFLVDRVKMAVDESGEPKNSFWVKAYVPTIKAVLRNRWTKLGVIGLSTVLFVASLALVPLIPTQFINAGSEKLLQVTVIPPSGASSDAVLAKAEDAEAILLERDDVEVVQTSVPGEGDTSFQTIVAAQQGQPANSATLTVRLDPEVDLGEATLALSEDLAPIKTNGYDVNVSEAAGFTSNNLNIIVSGSDAEAIATATDTVVATLSGRDDLINLKSNLVKATPEIRVDVDPNKAIGVGSTAAQIAGEVRGALVAQTATRLQIEGGDPVDLVVRIDPEEVTSLETLRNLPVGTVSKVPLGSVATVEQVDVQGSITRIDEAPAASISAEIASEDTGAVSQEIQAEIDRLEEEGAIPTGIEVRLAGVTQQQNEAFSGLFASMAVAVLLVYVMMVLAFNSLITPFIILFSLPLATIGAFPALVLTGRPIGVSALIGFLMLIGIVVTNAIVLLDLVERLRSQGLSTRDALIEGGKTRVRPILMTALATILALVPLAAGFNEGSIIAAELGTVVIGGLFSSTFLTLLVIPVIYSLVDGGKDRIGRIGRRSSGEASTGAPTDAPPAEPSPA